MADWNSLPRSQQVATIAAAEKDIRKVFAEIPPGDPLLLPGEFCIGVPSLLPQLVALGHDPEAAARAIRDAIREGWLVVETQYGAGPAGSIAFEFGRLVEPDAGTSKPSGKKRTGHRQQKTRPLTPAQTEAVQVVGECKGNVAEAARRLGKNRKTVKQAYDEGLAKLGREGVKPGKPKTQKLPLDRRGQEHLSEDDDRRG